VKEKIPDYREKQKLLYIDRTPPADLIRIGDAYYKAGRISDAVDFYEKAGYTQGLEKIREDAIRDGDTMAYQHVLRALRREASPEEWDRIGRRAFELRKWNFALYAFEKGGNTDLFNKTREIISGRDHHSA